MTSNSAQTIEHRNRGWFLLILAGTLAALMAVRSIAIEAHGPLSDESLSLASVSQSRLFPGATEGENLVISQAVIPFAVTASASPSGAKTVGVKADIYTIFQSPANYTWGEWVTWAGGIAAAYFIVESQNSGSGHVSAAPSSPVPDGIFIQINGDGNSLNVQGSGSGGSGQQNGQESLTGAAAGTGTGGSNQ